MKNKFNYRLLRGRIVAEYGTFEKFAKAYGTHKVLISEKLNNKSRFTTDNIVKCCELLNIPRDEIGMYFFNKEEEK